MIATVSEPKHCVAIIGGAVAGSTAAETLARAGVICIVFEQNDRPYGKIEDGLPRWHVKQRKMEYQTIDSRLDRPDVFFVPRTRLGTDLDFQDLLSNWGFSAILLANGAWRDRPLTLEGVDRYVGKGLIYQNPFIYWFNHKNERDYQQPRYEIPPGTMIVGGGLASIDVVKVVQIELYQAALSARGIQTTMLELEQKGIQAVCAGHALDAEELGVQDCVLFYRRRVIDMPLAQMPDHPTSEQVEKTQNVRKKILVKVLEKYRVRFHDCHLPVAPLVEGDQLVGLRFVRTRVDGRNVLPIPGSEVDVRSSLVISSIGSIPEPIPGIEMKGDLYCFKDWDTGQYVPCERVFGLGNVVTGQGNIAVSQKHSAQVAKYVLANYLGIGNGEGDISPLHRMTENRAQQAVEKAETFLQRQRPLCASCINSILARVVQRMSELGYVGYREWIKKVTPTDLE
ncbi:MAG: hypothetical protein HY644_12420 [Acidobacteria bacterium]|nr:hypothetical protein [Acidobacteriota bacterium]